MTLSFPHFLDKLDTFDRHVPLDDLTRLMREVDLSLAELEEYIRFSDDRYQRNLVRAGRCFHALVLCWKSGQCSPIHDHRGSSCGVRVLKGEMSETPFARDAEGNLIEGETHVLKESAICGSYDSDIHEVSNRQESGGELITLHIYSPPLLRMGLYERGSRKVEIWHDPVQELLPNA